jgi:hypothetical protein
MMNSFYDRVQAALPVLTTIPGPRRLDDALVESCNDYTDAVRLCLDKRIRKMQEGEIAAYLGLKRAQLAKVKMNLAKLSSDQEVLLQHLCSNWAIKQFRDMEEARLEQWLERPETMEDVIARKVAEQLAAMGHVKAA